MNKSLTNNSSAVGNTTFSCIAQKAKELVNGTNSIKFDSANNRVYFKYISQSPTNALSIDMRNRNIKNCEGIEFYDDSQITSMSNGIKTIHGHSEILNDPNVGLNTYKAESNLIEVLNQDKLFISSSFKGLSMESDLKINNSLLTLFSNKENVATYNQDNYLFEILNSTLVSVDSNPSFQKSANEPLYMIALNQKFEKNSALNFYNDDFMMSVILPSNYDNVYLSIASNELNEDSYRISKDGFINYAFDNNVSLNIGKPKNDNLIKNIQLNSSQLSY